MKTAELREAYLSFFESHDHRRVASSTLVPQDDPTLLFTNAGMNQFKDPLLGRSNPGYSRATSSQRCVRAGGKHNDLENVGYTARHHTFFEMLGNFSFGDYFKEEAITWAWQFVTQVLELPKDKLWITVHPTDADARELWTNKIGVPKNRVIDLEENFWTMGDTGPCGPCTELFYDHGDTVAGGPPGSPDEDGDRYVEFWNLVFPQFDRSADGTMVPLPKPGVDTGMGLERVSAILQGVHSNYEIDLFRSLMRAAGQFAGINADQEILTNPSIRVIADHIRSSAFLIADGVVPGNEDRAYVLRRIIRRGLRHGHMLNIKEPFFHKLVHVLADEMGEAYPQLVAQQGQIAQVLRQEEERFSETLMQGMSLLNSRIGDLKTKVIPGDIVFQLYDTYGFPADLTADVAREKGLTVDMDGFDQAMQQQRARGRASASFTTSLAQKVTVSGCVNFVGYQSLADNAQVMGLFDIHGEVQNKLVEGMQGVVVLDRTPFYAEAGGQVGDRGILRGSEGVFEVQDTLKTGEQHMHIGRVTSGQFVCDDTVGAQVDEERRQRILRNHSATHLLHAALRKTLGEHVQQKGSLVNDEKLRFDFSHSAPVSADQLIAIENMVNIQIRLNHSVDTQIMSHDEAIAHGATALFGEKYGDQVRVLTMGADYSVELCGGTHVSRSGDIGYFKIGVETGIAAGIRRIEAVTGDRAVDEVRNVEDLLSNVSQVLKAQPQELLEKVSTLLADNKNLTKQITLLNQKIAQSQGSGLLDEAVVVDGVHLLVAKVDGDNKAMMQTLDTLKSQLSSAVIVLAQESGGRVGMVVSVSKDVTQRITAPDLLEKIGPAVGAKGGGRADLARAGGGDNPAGIPEALATAGSFVRSMLASN
ncbi:MAG: alanine--tRNA ligase [Gammaproteobacteria bacterium]|nr:alanine--tRNA ligase [Gammaproteobacteria bacterium]